MTEMGREPLPEIRLSSYNYTVGHWLPRQDEIDFSPPYQRGTVWAVEQRQTLIKSLIMGVPIGAVIVSKLPYSSIVRYRVVDGKQRLETIRAFVAGEFEIPSWWLRAEYLHPTALPWVIYSDTTERFRRHFETAIPMPALEFDAYTVWVEPKADGKGWRTRQRTEAEAIQVEAELYGLINFGGTPQSDEDRQRAAAIAGGQEGSGGSE